ncbi:transcription-repair coupling factor [Candidatus Tokpelaia sp.]|uniref:transcription-repair coupling factor n=1 Tax=Candidatus Tokpelaia sp. TaxID=2233777 RepID=UPI00123B21BF|nr:transcription-repair coupling factor [Candidatus Tokpelaia sp.]KAA6404742.1 transcription-repair coupling factor [Candidatus Tokpelaia sp.]
MALLAELGVKKQQEKHIIIDEAAGGYLPFVLASLADEAAAGGPVLYIAHDGSSLADIAQMLRFIRPLMPVIEFPAWDCLPYDRVSPGQAVSAKRLAALAQIADLRQNNGAGIILTSANAILQKLPPRALMQKELFSARPGQKADREALLAYLENHGFDRVSTVRDIGEYAVRGSIIDIFPPGEEAPLRLDFFGDILETIRGFDPASQRSSGNKAALLLQPMREISLNAGTISHFRRCYVKAFGAATGNDALYQAISAGRRFAGMEHWLPLFYEQMETLPDYTGALPIIFDHLAPAALDERYRLIVDYYEARREQEETAAKAAASEDLAPYHPLAPEMLYLSSEAFARLVQKNAAQGGRRIDLSPFRLAEGGLIPVLHAGSRDARNFAPERNNEQQNLFAAVADYLAAQRKAGKKLLLGAWSEGSLDRLMQILAEHGVNKIEKTDRLESLSTAPRGVIAAALLQVEHGFESETLCLLAEQDILGDRLVKRAARRKRNADFISEAGLLSAGDIVVHIDHGIGRFVGLKTITAAGAPVDCLELRYAGDDRLFLPVVNIELLSRYGGESHEAQLDKLGGVAWAARKVKLKKQLLAIAGKLIDIAAQRQMRHAPELPVPPGLYDEFVARFPYDETEDQAAAIEAVLEDLASGRPMDRLVCGDVGFGKTEVALRAAFIAAMNGLQAAIVVPTTLLSRQHYKTFSERFQNLPLKLAQASRLVGRKELAAVKQGLKDGTVDIVIGTHALLSQKVDFARLGLLIIDEEQHFGVQHKERLKELKSDIHVLTLSATPIPRTLQMALTGVRELSLIATPPVDRMAVRSFVSPIDRLTIRETLLREHYRGGQSFYVCPHIADLEDVRTLLEEHVPELKFVIAHGQMPAGRLDSIMNAFYDGQYDVLLSTSIVESGLDIPSANSLIVHRADMFGLSALYQLRGRVGRSRQRAYALFTLPPGRKMTAGAERRLKVLQSLDSLGAGFQLASHDMDIRGAGNLLGQEQSGHIKEVGFELYQQMLEEAVAEMKDGTSIEDSQWSPHIASGLAVMIPESYVPDLQLRLGLYRRVGAMDDIKEIDAFAAELIDRFGPLPDEVKNLLKTVYIKILCRKANIEKLEAGPKGALVTLRHGEFANGVGLVKMIAEQGSMAKIRPDQSLVFSRNWEKPESRISGMAALAEKFVRLAAAG